ncbi:unnamed protein product [Effrenium voratum]|nr:unnamed protein product [Effrenium voratum]
MAVRGESGWQATHVKTFGKERWVQLRSALRRPVQHVVLLNPFMPAPSREEIFRLRGLQPHERIPLVFVAADETACGDGDEASTSEWLPCYFLDGASAIAAAVMDVAPGASVLDLCAAPGGKSLMLASLLLGTCDVSGHLVCNEMSRPRLQRLQKVMSSFLPPDFLAAGEKGHVSITNADAAGSVPVPLQRLAPFDYVLVDAPCTSDRHLVHQGGLPHWSAGAVKANAQRQLELLRSAASLVKVGGVVLYATCALAEAENDGVVGKFLKKFGEGFAPEKIAEKHLSLMEGADDTAFGVLILPDRTPYGPMYIALLRRSEP